MFISLSRARRQSKESGLQPRRRRSGRTGFPLEKGVTEVSATEDADIESDPSFGIRDFRVGLQGRNQARDED
ncbi:MAG: hypothetical protein KJ057_16625 [Phycisphaerae bacterium]|nr:hypothetical protein [Planctomycetia bacterium]MCK6465504.1 hypothetical protein [Phycisphaerae bacterium]MCL4720093.1 hypothetical protein [Phycisphaerae bacterium]